MPDAIHELLITPAAAGKIGARGISQEEAKQVRRNRHIIVRNLRGRHDRAQGPLRRLLIGRTDGGRALTLVVEQTTDPTTWLLVTGWTPTFAERRILRDAGRR